MSETFSVDAAEERYLAELRRRVAWQSEAAARERAQAAAQHVQLRDPLDPVALAALVEAHPDDIRTPERRAFLAELEILIEEDGRLPESVEGLIRLVFADLL
jgi:hypothetical protein